MCGFGDYYMLSFDNSLCLFRRGLITRNVKAAVDLFHERFGVSKPVMSNGWRYCSCCEYTRWLNCDFFLWPFRILLQITFSPAVSREFRPYKPDPAPLLHICSVWDVQPEEVVMIGDSLKDDVCNLLLEICYFLN